MKRLALFLAFFAYAGVYLAKAQTVQITGTITSSDDGQPLPGATVMVKNTTIGTTTDNEGKYTLSVPSDAKTLIISFMGMQNLEVEIGAQTHINVALKPETVGLEEVVVTAFGIKRQARELGYSTKTIDKDILNVSKSVNVANSLAGKVAGLQVNTVNNGINANYRIVLRGNRSFTGNNEALLVLDGVAVDLSVLNSINPDDIESTTTLKGANASALYGSHASNGVLIITTKSGTKNSSEVRYSNTTTWESVSFMPKFQDKFGSGSGSDASTNFPIYDPIENQCFGPKFDGSIVRLGPILEDGTFQQVTYSPLKNEKKKFFDTGLTVQHNFSYSGGDDKSTFYASVQDANINGVTPGDKKRRDVLNLKATRQAKWIKLTGSFNYSHINSNIAGLSPNQTRPLYWDIFNTPMEVPLTSYSDWRNDKFSNQNNYYNDYYLNPYTNKDISRLTTNEDRFNGMFETEITISKGLTLLGRTSLVNENVIYNNTTEKLEFNGWAKLHRSFANKGDYAAQVFSGSSNIKTWSNDAFLTFNKNIGVFSANFILGGSYNERYNKNFNMGSSNLVVDDFYNISNRSGDPSSLNESIYRRKEIATFLDGTIGFKQYLFLHFSGRNEWTSLLPRSERSYFFPGVDISLVFTDLIPSIKNIVNYGKLRGGIAQVGAFNGHEYSTNNVASAYGSFPYDVPGFTVSDTYYTPLKPELTTSNEFGLDLEFMQSRLNLSSTAYFTKTKNQVVNAQRSNTIGYSTQYINTGETKSWGYEFEFSATPISLSNSLVWKIGINYTYAQNEAISVLPDTKEISIGLTNAIVGPGVNQGVSNNVNIMEGLPFPYLKMIDWKRDPQGRVVVGADGMPIVDPVQKPVGQVTPKHMIGINTVVKFKGFELSAVAEYRGGAYIMSTIGNNMMFSGVGYLTGTNDRQRFLYPNSVLEQTDASGNVTYIPNTDVITTSGGKEFWADHATKVNTYYVTKADFWKLREVALSYSIPRKLLKSSKFIKEATIGFVAKNVLTLLPKSNYYTDPEFANNTGNAQGVTDLFQTPPTKTYGFNINLVF